MNDYISPSWLTEAGFTAYTPLGQEQPHFNLWLGLINSTDGFRARDLGVELLQAGPIAWDCWVRSDRQGERATFAYVRLLSEQREVRTLVEALSGQPWDIRCHYRGVLHASANDVLAVKRAEIDAEATKEWTKEVARLALLPEPKKPVEPKAQHPQEDLFGTGVAS